jgi:hypothetical protein
MHVWYWYVRQRGEAWSSLFGGDYDRMVFPTREAAEANLNGWMNANSDALYLLPESESFEALVLSARLVEFGPFGNRTGK